MIKNFKIFFIIVSFVLFFPILVKAEYNCKCEVLYDDSTKYEENVFVENKEKCMDYTNEAWDFGDVGFTSVCRWYEQNYALFGDAELKSAVKDLNQLKVNTPQELIGLVIKSVMGILGTITLVMIIYGGLMWMTSAGNSDKTQKARDIIIWASLGVVIIFASYAILNTIFDIFATK